MFLIVLTVLILQGVKQCCSSSLLGDFDALMELKLGMKSPEPALTTWNSSTRASVCSWSGVQCSRGRVVSLDLSDLNLQGWVSSSAISRLDGLTDLSLSGNNFHGPISISNLTRLQWLNISNNQFIGSLEWNFSSTPNLEVLDAYNNNFTCPLPLGIVRLRKLEFLSLGGNYFSGIIPGSYGSFPGLKYLSLAGNELRGKIPSELGNLTSLREIYLNEYNIFEGRIPRELGNLGNLVHMDLSSCGLHGEIPKELGNLSSLKTLYLHMNSFLNGSIPGELGNLTRLVRLDMSINSLTGEIPPEFANLERLELLNLFENGLHGSIPEFISELPRLERLELWRNNFTGMIPRNLGCNARLQRLDLSTNKLTGMVPPDLCLSNRLETLILLKNFLFGPIPGSLGTCASLVRVRLGQNYFNGSIPRGLLYLPKLNLLEIQNNLLSGTLPENYRNASSEKPINMDLSNNLFSGPLPALLSNFSNLQILLLNGNRLTGPIPSSVGTLREIVKLDFSQNQFSGPIPREVGECVHLTYLDLSQNNLYVSIPPEISNLQVLSYFNVSRNHLNQSIPESLGKMKSLTNADFSFNDFSGGIPKSGQFLALKASSFAGNPHLCGSIINIPCSNFTTVPIKDKANDKGPLNLRLILVLAVLVFSLAFATAAIIKAKRKPVHKAWKMTSFQKLGFGLTDILECLKDGNEIGRGGAGIVYHGKTPNGVEIAIKKLQGLGPGRNHHDSGFRAEIRTLGTIRHRNIVRLLAFCSNKETNLLVYEYMNNSSLGDAIHGKKDGIFLGWDLRYKVALEAARGLCYLHHDCSPMIVHRDVKSNNILLNSRFEAHIADFGLARFLMGGNGGSSECMSAVAGSYGYIAPEYAYTLQVNEKSDVYSFGVVLLELLTGRKPVGDFGEGVDIVQWTRTATGGRREEVTCVVDARLGLVPKDEARHIFFIAMLCVHENSVEWPTMREVVEMLSEFPRHLSSDSSTPDNNTGAG